ncbi:unnamed protein product, partial [marine sediment metagenome]
NITCNGASDGSIALTVADGTPPYTYAWTGPDSYTSTDEDPSALKAGNYSVIVTDDNGCTTTDNITLTEPDPLTISSITSPTYAGGYNITCNGASDGSIALTVADGTPPYTYAWTGPDSYTSTDEDPSALKAGNYSVIVTDDNGCTTTDNITLTEPDPLTISSITSPTYNGGYNISCNGYNDGSINIVISGGTSPYTFLWSGPAGYNSTNEDPIALKAGDYSVTVTDANGCNIPGNITLTEPVPLIISSITSPTYAGGYNISCNGLSDGSIELTVADGTPAYSYAWT